MLFLVPATVLAQVNVVNRSLTDSTLPVFYTGVENNIRFSGKDYTYTETVVSIHGAGSTLHNTGKGEYLVRVSREGSCSIVLSKNGKVFFRKEFTTSVVPYPVARLGGTTDTVLKLRYIQANPFLTAVMPDCFYKHNMRVVSFEALLSGQVTLPLPNHGTILLRGNNNPLSPACGLVTRSGWMIFVPPALTAGR